MNFRNIFLGIALLFSCGVFAQQDPEAKKILDRVSQKVKSATTLQADFELAVENRTENQKTSSKGIIKIKSKKYYMESMGTKVYFDGTTMWSFMEDVNEVTISTPANTSDDFVENPALIFDFYNRDFKYRLVGEVNMDEGWMYEIDLFPMNLEQPYSRFKILIKRDTDELFMVSAVGKEGVDYTVNIRNLKYNQPISDSQFSFDQSKHKNVEVIDLRF